MQGNPIYTPLSDFLLSSFDSSTFVKTEEPILKHDYSLKAVVYTMVHSTLYSSGAFAKCYAVPHRILSLY